MAFEIVEVWEDRRSFLRILIDGIISKISYYGYDVTAKRIFAAMMTIFIHLCAILLVYEYNSSEPQIILDDVNGKSNSSLSIFDFDTKDEEKLEEVIIQKPKIALPSPPDISIPLPLIESASALEWQVTKVPISGSKANSGASTIVANDDNLETICANGEIDVLANDTASNNEKLTIKEVGNGMGAVIKNNKVIVQTAFDGELSYIVQNESGDTATALIHIKNKC